jgi:hypothetical protein
MKFKNILLTLSIGIFLLGCSKENINDLEQETTKIPSKAEVNAVIEAHLETGEVYKWQNATPEILAGALVHSDSVAFVGYKPADETNIKDKIHLIDVKEAAWKDARQKVIDAILGTTNKLFPDANFTLKQISCSAMKQRPSLPSTSKSFILKSLIC